MSSPVIPSSRAVFEPATDAVDHQRERQAAPGVRLGVEEELGVADTLRRRAPEVGA